ncbi:MAG: phosphoenolpyruvate synthase [Candidatus Melainabacteria bacterium]|nr:phosphoenolpyruvate synthase [Candidatus Melainabacteria bacterium]
MKYILWYDQIGLGHIDLVGGKNASLGEMVNKLKDTEVLVPEGFAITSDAYTALIEQNNINDKLAKLLCDISKENVAELANVGKQARNLIKQTGLPQALSQEILQAYKSLCDKEKRDVEVAVRSSATAEDLPGASFAGQQESFLNIHGEAALLEACLNCFASLFTDRAIAYRIDKGFDHMSVRLSIGVQKMVRSDLASSGVMFSLDPETGFKDSVLVTSSYGLGENIVAGRIDPDEFLVFKPTLKQGFRSIVRRKVGAKQYRLIYSGHGSRTTKNLDTLPEERKVLSITDDEVLKLARIACTIEEHYSSQAKRHMAMDIEWAKDGNTNQIYIVQARPETIHTKENVSELNTWKLDQPGEVILQGQAIGEKIGAGPVRKIRSCAELDSFQKGEILVADMTDPDWEPVMKKASAIITNKGGRTCHAAIVSRELGVPCVVGTNNATMILKDNQEVTVSCAPQNPGKVFAGRLAFSMQTLKLDELPKINTKIMMVLGNPEQAMAFSQLPSQGVGLARLEFIIAHEVRIHPLALTRFDQLEDIQVKEQVQQLTFNYSKKEDYFIEKLAEGIATIASAFYPKEVIVRLSDFKTNEYANLLGGKQFEPLEENPMLGFRGASRYYSEHYKDGFALECRALNKARKEMGLSNLKVMIPFCRTVDEGKQVIAEMAKNGLVQHEDGLEIYVMCEIPANVILLDQFAEIFDGFSIGSNDLTQLVLGLDRDSQIVAKLFDERNEAVKRFISQAIREAKKANRKIGICGQAPSDYPEFAKFLLEQGIDSISLSPDTLVKTIILLAQEEAKTKLTVKV